LIKLAIYFTQALAYFIGRFSRFNWHKHNPVTKWNVHVSNLVRQPIRVLKIRYRQVPEVQKNSELKKGVVGHVLKLLDEFSRSLTISCLELTSV